MFAYVGPEHLELSASAEQSLRDDRYEIDAWNSGRMLCFNERYPMPTDEEHSAMIKDMVARSVDQARPSE
ncbi:hypothetical protein WKH79_01960 [Qipengyuania sp. GPGPB31]|uniref:hypothetical protein n=1 Tax=Qipengyuania sp. GPGPB31 TaxID=3023518 RepID=UPI0031343955